MPPEHHVLTVALVVATLVGCKKPAPVDSKPTEADREQALLKKHRDACVRGKHERCGDLLYMECDAASDGPSYYVRVSTGADISTCGGVCWHALGERATECKNMCPPPEWTCR